MLYTAWKVSMTWNGQVSLEGSQRSRSFSLFGAYLKRQLRQGALARPSERQTNKQIGVRPGLSGGEVSISRHSEVGSRHQTTSISSTERVSSLEISANETHSWDWQAAAVPGLIDACAPPRQTWETKERKPENGSRIRSGGP